MESASGPSPETLYPIKDDHKLVFLKNFVKSPNILVGVSSEFGL